MSLLLLLAVPVLAASAAYPDELAARSRASRLAEDPAWLALLHYKGKGSQADGPGFFLSPFGKTDPKAELESTLRAFFEPGPDGAQCRFPARYRWLESRLGFDKTRLPEQACPRFESWRDTIDVASVTLVFADAFIANPASMYGHTFLRLRKRGGAEAGLLDYTINFAGTPDTDNALFYALKGIYGAFPGKYSTMPFYMKVQEYGSIESRDLWEYDLNLSSETVAQLVRHAWEMGNTYFDYFFFSENCSYQLLTLLDGADASLGLSGPFGFAAIPADTVRAVLARPGLASVARYRPSHVREMLARRSVLTAPERVLAGRIGRLEDGLMDARLAALPKPRQAAVLDAAYDYLRYREGFQESPKPELAEAERGLLIARGRLGEPPSAVVPARPAPLEAGHETSRVGAGGGANKHGGFQEISWRAALHDLAAAETGYAEGSQLEMVNLQLRFDDRRHELYVERLALVDIMSLSPWDSWVRKPSWRVSTGVEQAKELGCAAASCMYYDLGVGSGLSVKADWPLRPLAYALAEVDAGAGPVFSRGWRLGGGGRVGVLLKPASRWRLLVEAAYLDYVYSPHAERLRLTSAWALSRNVELRLVLDRRTPDSEAGAKLSLYF